LLNGFRGEQRERVADCIEGDTVALKTKLLHCDYACRRLEVDVADSIEFFRQRLRRLVTKTLRQRVGGPSGDLGSRPNHMGSRRNLIHDETRHFAKFVVLRSLDGDKRRGQLIDISRRNNGGWTWGQ
jgi:hypothetical protein